MWSAVYLCFGEAEMVVLTIIDGHSRIQAYDDLMPHDKAILDIVWLGDDGAESDAVEPQGFAACWQMSGGRDDGGHRA